MRCAKGWSSGWEKSSTQHSALSIQPRKFKNFPARSALRVGWGSSSDPFGNCRRKRKEKRQSDIQHKAGCHAEPRDSHASEVEKWPARILPGELLGRSAIDFVPQQLVRDCVAPENAVEDSDQYEGCVVGNRREPGAWAAHVNSKNRGGKRHNSDAEEQKQIQDQQAFV